MSLTSKLLSGVEVNQNRADQALNVAAAYQEFYLPATITRGTGASEIITPPLTGFSVMVGIAEGTANAFVLDWELQRHFDGGDWQAITQGRTIGAPAEGDRVWIDNYFDEEIPVDPEMLNDKLRIKLTTASAGSVIDQSVSYEAGTVTIAGVNFAVELTKDTPTFFNGNGVEGVLYWDSYDGAIYYSNRQGATGLWTANVAGGQYTFAYTNANETGELAGTLTWRLLTASGDSGRDFLGNSYRHAIFSHKIDSVTTLDGEKEDRYWFSKPNPSRFAIENLFFDVRDSLSADSVIDSVLLDPITPNVYFSIYYSREGDPGATPEEWNEKLWERVPKVFKATRRESHALPQPVRAKYIKIEFTSLQPRSYSPGVFQQPIRYQKHPKWVLDYFLARINDQKVGEDQFVARRVDVQFNALDMAYNYFLDDLHQEPDLPVRFDPDQYANLTEFIQQRTDSSDLVDSTTLNSINTRLTPYRDGLASQIRFSDTLLNRFVAATLGAEGQEFAPIQTNTIGIDVSTLDREAVVYEQSFPVMYFYLTARHRYREMQASFEHDRAYFVGVREVAFLRERYDKATDTTMYIEIGGDSINLQSSDWVHDNTSLVIDDA